MTDNFPKRPSGAPLHTFDVPVGFVTPKRQCIALFAVAEGWLLLDIGWLVLCMSVEAVTLGDKI